MKITSVEITAENVPADLSVSKQGVMSGTPVNIGSTDVSVKAVTNYGEATGSLTVVVREAEPKRGFYKADGTPLADITLSDLKKKIGDGTALSEYGLGAYFYVPYVDPFDNVEYSCQYRFGHFGSFTYADGTVGPGLGLDCVSLLPSVGVQFDAPEPNNPDSNRKKYGSNRYRFSNLRQYMNSSGTGWYKAQHAYDAPPTNPSNWNSVKGLLDCFPSDFVDSLDPVQIKVYTDKVDNSVLDTLNDLFFLQSANALGGANVEGESWGGLSLPLVKKNIKGGNAQIWWTRTIYPPNYSGHVWIVTTTGNFSNTAALETHSFAPACVLRAS